MKQESNVHSRFAALGIPLASPLLTRTRTEVLERHRPTYSCVHACVRRRVRAVRACGACVQCVRCVRALVSSSAFDARFIAPNSHTHLHETFARQTETETETETETDAEAKAATNAHTRQDRDRCIHTHTHTHTHTHRNDTRSPRRTSSLGGGSSSFCLLCFLLQRQPFRRSLRPQFNLYVCARA